MPDPKDQEQKPEPLMAEQEEREHRRKLQDLLSQMPSKLRSLPSPTPSPSPEAEGPADLPLHDWDHNQVCRRCAILRVAAEEHAIPCIDNPPKREMSGNEVFTRNHVKDLMGRLAVTDQKLAAKLVMDDVNEMFSFRKITLENQKALLMASVLIIDHLLLMCYGQSECNIQLRTVEAPPPGFNGRPQ